MVLHPCLIQNASPLVPIVPLQKARSTHTTVNLFDLRVPVLVPVRVPVPVPPPPKRRLSLQSRRTARAALEQIVKGTLRHGKKLVTID